MDKRIILIIVLIVAVIGGAFGFLALNPPTEKAMQKVADSAVGPAAKAADSQSESQSAHSSQPGKYIDYSEAARSNAAGTVIIFFHASWCPQCRALETDIKKQGVPKNVTILKADYDTNQQLRQKYGVTIQTTVVKIDDKGNLIKKYVAYDEPTLQAVIDNLL